MKQCCFGYNKINRHSSFRNRDVRVCLNNQVEIDIEIQVLLFPFWEERSIFYLCKMFSDQIKEGESYQKLEKCIHVGILDYILFPEDEEYYSRFHLKEELKAMAKTDKYIEKAYDKLVHISADEEKRLEYEARQKAIRDYNHLMKCSWDDGLEQGLEQGLKAMIETCQEISMSQQETLSRIVKKCDLSEETAQNYIKKYWKNN